MQSNLDSIFKTNPTFEKEGVDFVLREKDEEKGITEISFRVRRFSPQNPRAKAAMAQYHKPYARMIDLGTLPPDKETELSLKMFIDISLVGWVGVVDANGKPIEFSKENAYSVLKGLPDLANSLSQYASSFENYKDEVGNS